MELSKFYLINIILLISVYESSPDVHGNTRKCSTLPIAEKASLKCIFSGFRRCNSKCLAVHVFQSNHQRSKMPLTCRNGNWHPKDSKCVRYSLNYGTEESNRHPTKLQILLKKYSLWDKSNQIGKPKNRHPMKKQTSQEKKQVKSIAKDIAKKILPDKYGKIGETDRLKSINVMKIEVLPDKAGGIQKLSDKYGKERMKSIADYFANRILPEKYGKTQEAEETDNLQDIYLMKIQVLPDKAGGTQYISDKYAKEGMRDIAEDIAKKILPNEYGKTRETDRLKSINLMKIQLLHYKAGGTQKLSDKYGKERMKSIAEDFTTKILPKKHGKTKETDIYLIKIQVLPDKAGGTQYMSDKYAKERMKDIAEDIAKKILF